MKSTVRVVCKYMFDQRVCFPYHFKLPPDLTVHHSQRMSRHRQTCYENWVTLESKFTCSQLFSIMMVNSFGILSKCHDQNTS